MDKWVILHAGSRFSMILGKVLGKSVYMVDIDTLVNETQVHVSLGAQDQHAWSVNGHIISNFCERILFQEVFYRFDKSLRHYERQDKMYVQFCWQAYLLSLFSQTRLVLNPVTPQTLTVSQYQFPRLLAIAESKGLRVPRYEIGRKDKNGYLPVDSLWFHPYRKCTAPSIMNVSLDGAVWEIIRFVRYDAGFLVTWPALPGEVHEQLLQVCNDLGIYLGEAYFRVDIEWTFYGLCPQLQASDVDDDVLTEIAHCIRDLGNGVL
ncbi:hypothetical protein [Candidatus Synchoanobacter obligatus]|uniref:Uncharacterized protein n=1 Tax=Candidatus Synchoanobacter obligatus TaxID=2919597 RepID=A0ABT1L532_9GAMM|nr:hypothetical protein [Candidatus Synchoanobacter obligatus]MCP8352289.1 hypothetical protein [Candidatus Synchoanobacter obligatus]